jgi:hypothetical protein
MLCSSVPVLFFINLGCGGDDIPVLYEPHQIIQISQKKTRGLVLSFFFHSNNDANPSRDYSGIERSLVINFHIISSEDFFSEKKNNPVQISTYDAKCLFRIRIVSICENWVPVPVTRLRIWNRIIFGKWILIRQISEALEAQNRAEEGRGRSQ